MNDSVNIIPLDRYAQLTDELKIGCREKFLWACEFAEARQKTRNTRDMDKDTVESLVNFLTMGENSYLDLVMLHRLRVPGLLSKLTGADRQQELYAHHMALQSLRMILAEPDSEPWTESMAHFWRDLDEPFQELGIVERAEIDYFFEILMGKPYSEWVGNHYVSVSPDKVLTSTGTSSEPLYIDSKYLKSPVREDCALSLFSVVVEAESSGRANKIEPLAREQENESRYWPTSYDPLKDDEPPFLLEEIRFFEARNPGHRHPSLDAALDDAFNQPVSNRHQRHTQVYFMGSALLTGTLRSKSFTVESVSLPTGREVMVDQAGVLYAVRSAAEKAGLSLNTEPQPSNDLEP